MQGKGKTSPKKALALLDIAQNGGCGGGGGGGGYPIILDISSPKSRHIESIDIIMSFWKPISPSETS